MIAITLPITRHLVVIPALLIAMAVVTMMVVLVVVTVQVFSSDATPIFVVVS
jgi:hypothetical protein